MNEMPYIGISFVRKNLHENLTWKTNYSYDAPSCILVVGYMNHIHVYCNLCNYYNFEFTTF